MTSGPSTATHSPSASYNAPPPKQTGQAYDSLPPPLSLPPNAKSNGHVQSVALHILTANPPRPAPLPFPGQPQGYLPPPLQYDPAMPPFFYLNFDPYQPLPPTRNGAPTTYVLSVPFNSNMLTPLPLCLPPPLNYAPNASPLPALLPLDSPMPLPPPPSFPQPSMSATALPMHLPYAPGFEPRESAKFTGSQPPHMNSAPSFPPPPRPNAPLPYPPPGFEPREPAKFTASQALVSPSGEPLTTNTSPLPIPPLSREAPRQPPRRDIASVPASAPLSPQNASNAIEPPKKDSHALMLERLERDVAIHRAKMKAQQQAYEDYLLQKAQQQAYEAAKGKK